MQGGRVYGCSITCAGDGDSGVRRLEHRPVVAIYNNGGAWMALSKAERATLQIDGESVVELDYSSCHLRLLLSAAGEEAKACDLTSDAYAVAVLDRRAVKLGILVLLNARDTREAKVALERRLAERNLLASQQTAAQVIEAVNSAFPMLVPVWSTGIGVELMNVDAAMCLSVVEKLIAAGIVVLCVYDSFIVAARHEVALKKAMEDAFDAGMREARRRFGPRLRADGICGRGLTSTASSSPPVGGKTLRVPA